MQELKCLKIHSLLVRNFSYKNARLKMPKIKKCTRGGRKAKSIYFGYCKKSRKKFVQFSLAKVRRCSTPIALCMYCFVLNQF